jgi:hypothetical protein
MTRHPHRPSHHQGLRLSLRRKRALYAIFGGAWATGILWLVFHYFLYRQGEFGAEPHPLEIWWLRLHGACAFAALWLGGLLWTAHVRPALARPGRRRSGLLLLGLLAILAATGYLLYYAGDDRWRDVARWLHWLVGVVFAFVLGIHVMRARAARGRLMDAQARTRASI